MSDIFIHVYLDEDVDVLVASLLRFLILNSTTADEIQNQIRYI